MNRNEFLAHYSKKRPPKPSDDPAGIPLRLALKELEDMIHEASFEKVSYVTLGGGHWRTICDALQPTSAVAGVQQRGAVHRFRAAGVNVKTGRSAIGYDDALTVLGLAEAAQ